MTHARPYASALVLALLFGGTGIAAAADPIRIGAFLSLTGPASLLGEPELKTLQFTVEKLNAEGGVLGRPLELVHYDDGGDAAKANTFAKRLIENDHVDVIVGGTTTGTTMAAVSLIERAEVPFISLGGAVVIVEPVKKWVFKTSHTDRMVAEKILDDMKQRGLMRLGLITGTGGLGKSGREQTLEMAKKLGVQVVADETYAPGDTDMTTQLTKLRASTAQALLNFDFGQSPAIVTKNVRQLGIDLPFYQTHGVASREFLDLAGPAAEGVRLAAAALPVAEQLPESDPLRPVVVGFARAYQARFGEEPPTFAGTAYDALVLAVDAMKRAGSSDKGKVRDALESTHGFVGTEGVVNMSPQDHLGLGLDGLKIIDVRKGTWVLVR